MNSKDIEELFSALSNKDGKAIEKAGKEVSSKLSDEQKKIVERALNDKVFLDSLLSSAQAKEIMRKIQGGKQ